MPRKDVLNLLDGLPKMTAKAKPKASTPQPVAVQIVEPANLSAEREISALKAAFIERSDKENARYTQAVDSEYWFAVCFQSREQKNEFLKASGLHLWGNKYIDGKHVAAKLKITLPASLPSKSLKKLDPKLSALVKEM